MVNVKSLAVLLAAIFSAAACSTTSAGSSPSPYLVVPPANTAHSKAIDLRVRLNLLLGEQVMVVAKQAAAAAAHNDEYTGYASLLNTNGNDIVDVIASAVGNQAAAQFKQAWDVQNGYLVDYTIGVVTHNADKSNGAMSGLQNGFVPQFAQEMASLTRLQAADLTPMLTQRLSETKTVLDEELAQSYSTMYPNLHMAYMDSLLGDVLTKRMVELFPDKFPGGLGGSADDMRVSLNSLLQEHAYIATMATDAAAAGRKAEQAAAVTALGANADALGKVFAPLLGHAAGAQFSVVWSGRDSDLVNYAIAGDAGSRQSLTEKFVSGFDALAPSAAGTTHDQVLATLKVIDDQRGRSYLQVAGDDRAAASAMQPLADRIY
jgi:hypothetical protein